jgi:2'-5' RNA ligase
VKRVVALAGFYDLLAKAQLPERHFRVSSFKLYKSEGTDDGHKYTVLATFSSKDL